MDIRPVPPGLIEPAPIVGADAEAASREFVERYFPTQERNGFEAILRWVAAYGVPEGISDLFDGDNSSSPYRSCTEPRAARPRARKSTERIDGDILKQPWLAAARATLVDLVRADYQGCRSHVLKAALVTAAGVAPVEVARATDRETTPPALVKAHVDRLARAKFRVPQLTTDPEQLVVDSMAVASLRHQIPWTGRVPGVWTPPFSVRWIQPSSADVLSIAEAVEHDPRRSLPTDPGFATLVAPNGGLLVAYGPTLSQKYYVHRSRVLPGGADSVAVIERRMLHWVEHLERLGDPLAEFPIERLQISPEKPNSYRYVTRRILMSWQYAHWQPPAPKREDRPAKGTS